MDYSLLDAVAEWLDERSGTDPVLAERWRPSSTDWQSPEDLEVCRRMATRSVPHDAKRIPMRNGDEYDYLAWRHVFRMRPGQARRVKHGYNRRLRQRVREALRE